ncbi:hypothetical protein TCAL_10906 [Tigriopus californicus]|uniref:Thioredoxin domain-containing protein n=1 Tax=Tigriopus californicus TaxID=6832 RepID=A0A553PJS2_TIGCA|nr:glutaredoxin-3-like [Tigriopus californicus]TRY77941.1 hypothetical protein TCAL_10906 [Tigriopus californicus]|eukprot:TCALIF_10906-PA protein Name:"Similar to glrx3 Glutaredoxin-3 (Xenopus tropicalis)" AED:0.03 eAED:0.03 QI:0/-1/0/1/-1/1/1/0/338
MTAIVNVTQGLKSFHSLIEQDQLLSVVFFWADWASQCGPMDEAIKILATEPDLKNVQFLRVEAEEKPEIAMAYEVAAVPTFLFFGPAGKLMDRIEGAKMADVTKKVRELAVKVEVQMKTKAAQSHLESKPGPSTKDLKTRLKELTNASPAMLFLKGSPSAPECGFSRQTVIMLDALEADYGYFDILKDNEVRQGLKEYSQWPTYPQLYVKGELVGGLDILKEMHENGELAAILPKKKNLDERLKSLTHSAPVMVFMKGNPDAPKCGFSRTLMEILADTQIKFQTFDILQDDEVRQGLKSYSQWPTYPQVYVKGELVGGLDIIKELNESNDLVSTLKGQ